MEPADIDCLCFKSTEKQKVRRSPRSPNSGVPVAAQWAEKVGEQSVFSLCQRPQHPLFCVIVHSLFSFSLGFNLLRHLELSCPLELINHLCALFVSASARRFYLFPLLRHAPLRHAESFVNPEGTLIRREKATSRPQIFISSRGPVGAHLLSSTYHPDRCS